MTDWFELEAVEGAKGVSAATIVTPLIGRMSSVPAERADIDHEADEKSEFEVIDWGTNFVV